MKNPLCLPSRRGLCLRLYWVDKAGSGPCALARPWSPWWRGGGAQLGGRSPTVQLVRSVVDAWELGSGIRVCGSGRSTPARRSFVPEIFNALVAYHAVILLHVIHGPNSVVYVLLTATVASRPYLCQVDRTIVDSTMSVSGRLHCVGSATLET
ncbi:hypothetical protein B296_00031384 [Ensete ventricosum]|uniref:Uncharacterized protein n=1 Tax=Ensete ventricosum TaxID=4639 RepID=A0A426Y422_ENSVE|nr:hypothetical protein B296_00031384 [Ensete ventricosum]